MSHDNEHQFTCDKCGKTVGMSHVQFHVNGQCEEERKCGSHGYRFNSRPCTMIKGHDGPCSWDS